MAQTPYGLAFPCSASVRVTLWALVMVAAVTAQTIDIRGRVVDEDGSPLDSVACALAVAGLRDTTDPLGEFAFYNAPTFARRAAAGSAGSAASDGRVLVLGLSAPGAEVHAAVYDMRGVVVAVVADGWFGPGTHRIALWNAATSNLARGVFLLRVSVAGRCSVYRLLSDQSPGFSCANRPDMRFGPTKALAPGLDTIVCGKPGYLSSRTAVDTYVTDVGDIVLRLNHAPRFITTADSLPDTLRAGRAFVDTLRAADPDMQTLSFSMSGDTGGVRLTDSVLSWTPAPGDTGVHRILLRVTDPLLAFDTLAWTVRVLRACECSGTQRAQCPLSNGIGLKTCQSACFWGPCLLDSSYRDNLEPNDTRTGATYLGDITDCDNELVTATANIYPFDNDDWFMVRIDDSFTCTMNPRIQISVPSGHSYRVTVIGVCRNVADSSDTTVTAPGDATTTIDFAIDCRGAFTDDHALYVRIEPITCTAVRTYTLMIRG